MTPAIEVINLDFDSCFGYGGECLERLLTGAISIAT